jgi:diguanylate cyclase (GGDEF)-like protein
MRKTYFAVILTIVMMLSSAVLANAEQEPIRVVIDDNYPPYVFRNDDGELVGISVDIWRLFEKKTGRKVDVTGMDWGVAQEKMADGEFDVIDTMFKNETREQLYELTQPYSQIDTALYFSKNISGIVDLKSARGFSVATKKGDYSITLMKDNGIDNIVLYESYEEIVTAAGKGEIVMFIMDNRPAQYFLYKAGLQDEFKYTEPIYSNSFYRAINKGNPKLLSFINFGFNQITESEKEDINDKWYGERAGLSQETERIIFILIGGVLFLLLMTLAVGYYSRKQVSEKTREIKNVLDKNSELAERLKAVINSMPDMIFVLDNEGVFVENMMEPKEVTKFIGGEFSGKSIEDIFPGNMAKTLRNEFNRFIETGAEHAIEISLAEMGLDNQYEVRFVGIGEDSVLAIARDITESNKAKQRLYNMSVKDALTGVYNRNYFERKLSEMDEENGNFGILVCDVDALKLVNDILGHIAGDDYLKTVAEIIQKHLPQDAFVARVGGDEFAILLKNTSPDELEKLNLEIKEDLRNEKKDYSFVPTNLSVGYGIRNKNAATIRELYKFADDEMYREKTNHRYTRNTGDISLLTNMLEARSFETEAHAKRMEENCIKIGKVLGFAESRLNKVSLLAKFHDIGKIGIRDSILLKPDKLTAVEFEEMKTHPEIGYRIANSLPDIDYVAEYIYKHHEWYDGTGYPFGLRHDNIPLECRILSVADAYDAMTNDRPYRKALGKEMAIAELKRCAGKQFDPHIVSIFIEIIEKEENS